MADDERPTCIHGDNPSHCEKCVDAAAQAPKNGDPKKPEAGGGSS